MFMRERLGLSIMVPIESWRVILHAQSQTNDSPRSQPARSQMASKEGSHMRDFYSMVARFTRVKLRPVFHGSRYGYTQNKHQAIPAGKSRS